MLEFQNYLYEVKAEVNGWIVTDFIESEITLPKNEVARLGYDLFGLNANLICYRMRTI